MTMKKIAILILSISLCASSFGQETEPKKEVKEVKAPADKVKKKSERNVNVVNEKQVHQMDVKNRKREVRSTTDLSGSGSTSEVKTNDSGKNLDRIREEAENEKAVRKERMMQRYSSEVEGGEERVQQILEAKPEEVKSMAPENRLEANKIRANYRLTEIAEQIRIAEAKIAKAEESLANEPDNGNLKVEDRKHKIAVAKEALEKLKQEMAVLKNSIK